jgi:hypothetical protein
VGTNKRYAAQIEQRTMMRGRPLSLTEDEKMLDELAVTTPPRPVLVHAWVRYPEGAVRIRAEAVAWTARAVSIRWVTPTDEKHEAWVWVSAVDRQR